ncbi:MAG: GtrA family protein [Bacilli bacterium]|jgi:putative flippase GtrA|nr:GtrA family protein [Bacilli bacterium]MCH4210205.1 GtrA family protein [Bacilli bacterium]MCH4228158.1 GtrA family protein [Bacilli bacterium]MCH4277844.1 GtrA family protein [Bacilli bacterium]MCI2054536.1 GtrA family protein [Bacilli bacterium]
MNNIEEKTDGQNVAPTKDETAKKKSKSREILRFVVIGLLCTAVDFTVQLLLTKYAFGPLFKDVGSWGNYASWGISVTIAFIISNIVNFIFSRTWVFQNVDKSVNTKSGKAWWSYFGLGAGGFLIGLGLQELGVWICDVAWGLNLSYDITVSPWGELLKAGDISLYAFLIIFCCKTLVTMVYNYETRKHLIFKAPKETKAIDASATLKNDDGQARIEDTTTPVLPVQPNFNSDVIKDNEGKVTITREATLSDTPVTKERFEEIFKQELEEFMGPAPVKQSDEKTRAQVRKAIDEEMAKRKEGK